MDKINSPDKLISKLKLILLKQKIILFTAGLLTTITSLVLTMFILTLVANIVILPVAIKISLLVLSALLTIYFFARYSIAKLFEGNIDNVAVSLEKNYPDLKGRLVAAIQFARNEAPESFSKDLINLNLKQALEKMSSVNFDSALSFSSFLRNSKRLAVAATVATLFVLILPGLFSHSYNVYSNPTSVVAPPLGYRLAANPSSGEWIKYRDITIGGFLTGDNFPDEAIIHYRYAGGSWQESIIDLKLQRKFAIDFGDSLSFVLNLRQVNKSFDYYVESGKLQTEIKKIDVVDRPRVNEIKLSIFYPDYTGQEPSVIDENKGSLAAVTGSRVSMQIKTNMPVETAELITEEIGNLPMKVEGKTATVSFVVENSFSYYIRLINRLDEENPDPIEYYVTEIPDEYPSIDVIRPGFDVNLSDEMLLPLKLRIYDDYGFSSLVLKYSIFSQRNISDENVAVLHFSDRIKTEGEIEFNWDLDVMNLFPGDYVQYYFEVADNDRISGSKITESNRYIARLPSLDELIADIEGESAQRIIKSEELLNTGKELTEQLKQINRKLQSQTRQSKKMDWQNKKEIEKLAQKNEELLKNIEQMAEQMNKSVEKVAENNLISREVIEKLEQIQKLYAEIATPEMKEAQKKLMEALKKMNQQELKEAIKNFEMSQKDLLERLKRTLALLKKLQLEQKMEAMLRQAEELAKRQEEMNNKTSESDKKELPSMKQSEDNIKESLNDLKKSVAELKELFKDPDLKESPESEKFSKAIENTDADKNMEKMSKAMSDQNKESAKDQGKKALTKLLEMVDQMQQQLAAMKGDDQDKIKKAMRDAIDDANHLSQNQEELLKNAGRIDPASIVLRDIAAAQQDLISSCAGLGNRISELGKQSPFIAAELQSLLNQTLQNMELAKAGFDNKKGFQAANNQQNAMAYLNKAAVRLMESLDQQNNCDKGGSCSKPTSKLQSISEQQSELNKQTQSQCNNPGANPKPGAQGKEAMRKLAAEQSAIRKSMEELNKEFGGSRQILGRLDEIAKEMKKIEEAMQTGEIGQEILERQLKIYSRMMEASRSLYRKDFTDQRKSNTATTEAVFLPPELTNDILNNRQEFENRLNNYLGDSYPPQYEKQIKAYFKALLNAEQQK